MNDDLDDMLMGHALDEARQALAKSHFPVGALLAVGERIVATSNDISVCYQHKCST